MEGEGHATGLRRRLSLYCLTPTPRNAPQGERTTPRSGGVHRLRKLLAAPRRRHWRYFRFTGPASRRRADQGRLQHGDDRRGGAERQAASDRSRSLARRRQRQGRPARPAGRARLLRRSEQPFQRSGHLHQADRRRQSRSFARPVRHQHGGGGDAGDHRERQGHGHLAGGEREPAFQLRPLFLDGAAGAGRRARRSPRASSRWPRRNSRSRRRSRSFQPTPSSPRPPPTARARTPRPTASTSSTTRATRRRPPISRRPCARSRPPIPTWCSSPPIRPTPSASCARRTRSD